MTPLVVLTIGVILFVTPLLVWASAYCLALWRQAEVKTFRLSIFLVLAVVMLAKTIAAELLTIRVLVFVFGAPLEWQRASFDLVLLSIDMLLPVGVIVALYLRSLRGSSEGDSE